MRRGVICKTIQDKGGTALQIRYLWVVSHDVVETRQEAQTGTNLHVHCTVHIVEEIQRLVDQLTALLQKT